MSKTAEQDARDHTSRVGMVDGTAPNSLQRELALRDHIDKLPANLLRAYVLELVEDAPPAEVDKLVVTFRAQGAVPAKEQ